MRRPSLHLLVLLALPLLAIGATLPTPRLALRQVTRNQLVARSVSKLAAAQATKDVILRKRQDGGATADTAAILTVDTGAVLTASTDANLTAGTDGILDAGTDVILRKRAESEAAALKERYAGCPSSENDSALVRRAMLEQRAKPKPSGHPTCPDCEKDKSGHCCETHAVDHKTGICCKKELTYPGGYDGDMRCCAGKIFTTIGNTRSCCPTGHHLARPCIDKPSICCAAADTPYKKKNGYPGCCKKMSDFWNHDSTEAAAAGGPVCCDKGQGYENTPQCDF